MWAREWGKSKDTLIPISSSVTLTLDRISDGKKEVLTH